MAQSHQSGQPDGVSHGASAGSGSPLHKSGSQGLQDQIPLRRSLACPYDSAENSSVNQLQRGQRWEGKGEEKNRTDLGSDCREQ